MTSTREAFRTQMCQTGLETNDSIYADGRLHRFNVTGDRKGARNGWYILYSDFPAVGIFGCWKRGIWQKWQQCKDACLTVSDLRTIVHLRKSIQVRHAKVFQVELDARREAEEIWQSAKPATDRHNYLVNKVVKSHGLRYYRGALLIPVTDADGIFHGMQRIWPNGSKGFCKGTITSGHFFIVGERISATILICEGYSTGATLHELTDLTVIVSFGCHNLRPVAKVVQAAWPNSKIIICADDDHNVPGNPGMTAAVGVAATIGSKIAIPRFPDTRGTFDSDFNDLYRLAGGAAVLESLREIGGDHANV